MFGRGKDTRADHGTEVHERPIAARGGVSIATILTGALVAFGAFFLLSSIVGAVLSNTGVSADELAQGDAVDAGIAGGIALLVALFLSFLWGGYTAGRMGRGSGFLNGLLVPIGTIVLAVLVGGITWALGASEEFNVANPTQQLQVDGDYTSIEYGIGLAAITIGVMFLASILGGILGSRWHTKLERRVEQERHEEVLEQRRNQAHEVDVRERHDHAEREHAAAAERAREAAATERARGGSHDGGGGTTSTPPTTPQENATYVPNTGSTRSDDEGTRRL
ncbi:MAG: YrzE family protein [Actinomycetota bacterium]|nr:YrzE family protein [Actinomycetota bacterium]